MVPELGPQLETAPCGTHSVPIVHCVFAGAEEHGQTTLSSNQNHYMARRCCTTDHFLWMAFYFAYPFLMVAGTGCPALDARSRNFASSRELTTTHKITS